MTNPASYSTVPFGGLRVMEVDTGTEITDERTGQSFIVTEDTFVTKGSVLFCTKKMFERLKEDAHP